MLPKRFLHYEVLDKISSTGMTEIYKVRNLKLAGRIEALKLLSDKYRKNKEILNRFRQEAEILSSLNHRCIPVIYEINEYRGRPFITMEFVDGKSLLDITEYKILSLGKIMAIGREIVAGLKEAHTRGIIHRDLKLSNIMITQGGGVKLMDFGLAATGWATPEEDKGVIIGTLPYMSPEQTRGDQLDHRTDIFSLGICLYELISGRLPFFDPEAEEVLRRVRELNPRSIREQRPETPDILERCIFRCIEKDPRQRFQNLDDLNDTLEQVEKYLNERGESLESAEAVRDRMEILSMDMVAREEEYGLLTKAYFRAITGKGCALFIEGEAGIGKTRLIEELIKHLDASKVNLASGQAHPGVTIPFRAVADAIRYLLLSCDVVTDDEVREFIDDQYGRAAAGRIMKSLLLHTSSEEMEIAGRENVFDVVSDFLAGLAAVVPLVMIIENVHWADKATLDLLAHLTGSILGRKILLIVSFRLDEPGREEAFSRKPFADIVEDKGRRGDAHLLHLNRLNAEETQNLVNFYFSKNQYKKSFHKRIFSVTDGNPLFILELLKLFTRIGVVTNSEEGWIQVQENEEFPVPTRVNDLIIRKLSCLTEKEMQVLEAAAVEGVSFSSETVGHIIRMERLAVLNILRTLWRQQVIELKGDTYRFDPPLAREVIYRQMMPELKRAYHQLLARIYMDSPPPGKGSPADIARHFHLGGDHKKAVEYYRDAGYSALNLHADQEALEYFDCALELLETSDVRIGTNMELDIHLNRAEIFLRMGNAEKSREAANESLALAKALGDRNEMGRALKMKGKLRHIKGDSDAAAAYLKEALGYAKAPSDRAEILNLLGLTAENMGDHKAAMARFSESLAISNASRNRLRMAQTLNHMGRTYLNIGNSPSALARFKKALEITQEIGDRRGIAVNTNNLGVLLRRMDRLQDALKLLFRAARIFKEIRYPHGAANTLWNIGTVFRAQGNRDKAKKFVGKAHRIFERISSQWGLTLCQLSLGNILAEAGDVDGAFDCFSRSLETGEKIGYPRVVAYGLASRGALELALGLIDQAAESLAAGREVARNCGDLGITATMMSHLGLAQCLAGQRREGVSMVEEAVVAGEKSRDTGILWETNLLLCRAALLAGDLSLAERGFLKASSHIGRNTRLARKAELYFTSGLLDLFRKRPQQAGRKFKTALALQRRLDRPLKMLECLHGILTAFSDEIMNDRLHRVESEMSDLIQRMEESISSPDRRRIFKAYHSRKDPLGFLPVGGQDGSSSN